MLPLPPQLWIVLCALVVVFVFSSDGEMVKVVHTIVLIVLRFQEAEKVSLLLFSTTQTQANIYCKSGWKP